MPGLVDGDRLRIPLHVTIGEPATSPPRPLSRSSDSLSGSPPSSSRDRYMPAESADWEIPAAPWLPNPAAFAGDAARLSTEAASLPAVSAASALAEADAAMLAGFRDCAEEAIRFLLEEEGRSPDDPAVVGLSEHLQARSAYLEYLTLLRRLDADLTEDDQLTKLLRSGPEDHPAAPMSPRRRRLVERAFRGCDLVQQSQPIPAATDSSGTVTPPSSGLSSPPPISPTLVYDQPPPASHRLYFHNNDYLEQVLTWAHSTDSSK